MRLFLFFITLLGLAVSENGFSGIVLAASNDADVIITECKKRTGLSETSCLGLIKKYMNVDRCQEYTNLSAKECEEKIKALKEDPKLQRKPEGQKPPTTTATPPVPSTPSVSGIVTPINLRERILQAKREKEQRFTLIQEETRVMIAYLKQAGQDTTSIETMMKEFDQKRQSTLLAYDQYQSIAESMSSGESFALEGPRQTVLRVLRDTTEYYRNVLLPTVRQQVTTLP